MSAVKPYSLTLHAPILLGGGFVTDLTSLARGWRRSIRHNLGSHQGTFTMEDLDFEDLKRAFYTWLGHDVREEAEGVRSWRGMVYEMTLVHAGERRRISLDTVANRVRTTYSTLDYVGDNEAVNPGFESVAASGPNVFDGWPQQVGSGGAVAQTGDAHDGAVACAITSDTDGPDGAGAPMTWVRQNLNLTAGNSYKLTFWTRGDGSHAGRWALRDPNAAEWIVAPQSTLIPGATYGQKAYEFAAPSEGEVLLFFYGPSTDGTQAYFDDVAVNELVEVVYQTDWAENAESIDRYGQIEEQLQSDRVPLATAEAYRDRVLAEHAWPQARNAGSEPTGATRLEVLVVGYGYTAQWRYATPGDDQVAMSARIIDIVTNDCELLALGSIQVNALEVLEEPAVDERALDAMMSMVEIGGVDGSGSPVPFVLYVDGENRVHYEALDLDPVYYMRGQLLYNEAGADARAISPWLIRPGVVRNLDWGEDSPLVGSIFRQGNDSWIEEVEVSADGKVVLKPAEDVSEAELMAMQLEMYEVPEDATPAAPWAAIRP